MPFKKKGLKYGTPKPSKPLNSQPKGRTMQSRGAAGPESPHGTTPQMASIAVPRFRNPRNDPTKQGKTTVTLKHPGTLVKPET